MQNIAEHIEARYECDHCEYVGGFPCPRHDDEDGPMYPVEMIGVEVECLNVYDGAACEHNGCNLSDCLQCTQEYGECRSCGGPARIVILPPGLVRYAKELHD